MFMKIRNSKVSVTGKNIQLAIRSTLFLKWLASLDEKINVLSIEIQSVDTVMRKGKEEVLFLKIKTSVTDKSGKLLPGIVFLRGPSVGILIIFQTRKHDYVVLIESTRPAIGIASYPELPAGMIDNESNVLRVALREMKEETDVISNAKKMVDLTETFFKGRWNGVYPSPGACDELIRLFLYRQKSSEAEVKKMQGRKTGVAIENEHLKLKLVNLEDVCRITPDVKVHSACMMYMTLKKEGVI